MFIEALNKPLKKYFSPNKSHIFTQKKERNKTCMYYYSVLNGTTALESLVALTLPPRE